MILGTVLWGCRYGNIVYRILNWNVNWYIVLYYPEFPESCDPIIPLAAQELMRKMIRQFAVEYAHKIQTAENQNAITQTEPDGPLDLTLSRNAQCAQQGDHHTN